MTQTQENALIFLAIVLFTALVVLVGCTTVPVTYPRGDLAHQILHVRTGHGLSSQAEGKIVSYDLADQGIRAQLGELGFVCKFAGRRFEVCPDQPGFCRYTYSGIWPFRKRSVEYVAETEELRLVQAHMTCFSKTAYDYDAI